MQSLYKKIVDRKIHIAPLISFRLIFGAVMFISILRFILKGWVYDMYVMPQHYFPFYGFEWIKPLNETGMYAVFALMLLATLGITLGFFYRISSALFFILFTYVELIDKSNYLNHYYFISLVAFLMIFLPAHRYFSIDVKRKPELQLTTIPYWPVFILQLQLALVYFFAGIAKLNSDWLFEAMPLKIWLPANSHLPIIGDLLRYTWVAYAFSWFGALYDLFIVFFLINKRTRLFAYICVIVFHVMTRILFQIGMFPYIMIGATLIFFSENFHIKIIESIRKALRIGQIQTSPRIAKHVRIHPVLIGIFVLFFSVQLIFPLRHLGYPGKLFWTEEGYRFSWRVMLIEKAGTAFFYVSDPKTGKEMEINNCDYLTKNQEKMMATQPDMILQFAKIIEEDFKHKGISDPRVRVESYVTLNGSGSKLFIDSSVDLTNEEENFAHKKWIIPYKEEK